MLYHLLLALCVAAAAAKPGGDKPGGDAKAKCGELAQAAFACLDAASAAALSVKDDAVLIELAPDVAAALAGRVRRSLYALTPQALATLCERHPWLASADEAEVCCEVCE